MEFEALLPGMVPTTAVSTGTGDMTNTTPDESPTLYTSRNGNHQTTTLPNRYSSEDFQTAQSFLGGSGRLVNGRKPWVTKSGSEESKNDPEESKHDSDDIEGYLFEFNPTFKLTDESTTVSLDDLFSGLENFNLLGLSVEEKTEVNNTRKKRNDLLKDWTKMKNEYGHLTDAIIRPFEAVFEKFGNKAEFEKGVETKDLAWEAIAGLSRLVQYPKVIERLVSNRHRLRDYSDPLLFAFAARNILARIAFHTVVNLAVLEVFAANVGDDNVSKYRWNPKLTDPNPVFETFTIIGFNRLFSPRNRLGISLSSDLDYKLVFKADNFVTNDVDGEGLSEKQKKKFVKELHKAQDDLKKRFNHRAGLTLEVQPFTTREIDAIDYDLKNKDAEKNFLASIYYNNVRITGSPALYLKFKTILATYKRTNKNDFSIAERTWIQYLGETDKGSMTVIQHLKDMKEMVAACAPFLVAFLKNLNVSNVSFVESISHQTGLRIINNRMFDNPNVLKEFLNKGGENLKVALDSDQQVKKAVKKLKAKIFGSIASPTDVLKRVSKVMSGLIDEDYMFRAAEVVKGEKFIFYMYHPSFSDTCLKQIGSKLVIDEEWRFSLKFCGCRLNDFFDSVPLEEYVDWYDRRDNGKKIYDHSKMVAAALNKFAIQMQNNIYLLVSNPENVVAIEVVGGIRREVELFEPKAATHLQIDSLYARITRVQFMDMIVRDGRDDLIHLREQMKELIATLLPLSKRSQFTSETTNLEQIMKRLDIRLVGDDDTPAMDGKEFFETLFRVSMATATRLRKPNRTF